MTLGMFNRASLSEQVEDALRREITEGKVLPGQRVSIADYQHAWKVSSTPFRDAVRTLETQGFLVVEPRKGVFVAPMNRQTMREIFAIRIALECMAIELAVPHVPQAEAEALRDTYHRLSDSLTRGEPVEMSRDDRAIHDLARNYCGNSRLQRLLVDQQDLIVWAQNTSITEIPHSYELALPEHIAIIEAICDRDGPRAIAEMRRHLENSRARLEAKLAD